MKYPQRKLIKLFLLKIRKVSTIKIKKDCHKLRKLVIERLNVKIAMRHLRTTRNTLKKNMKLKA